MENIEQLKLEIKNAIDLDKKRFFTSALNQTNDIIKMVEELKFKEQMCMEEDKHEEQILEHMNQIEMCNKILQKLNGNTKHL